MEPRHVLLSLVIILLFLPVVTALQPEMPPPALYGWVSYDDGTPVPRGIVVSAQGCGYTWATSTGNGTLQNNTYVLTLDIPGVDEDCNITVNASGRQVWTRHVHAGDIVRLDITLPKTKRQPSSTAEPGTSQELQLLSGNLTGGYTPSQTPSGGENDRGERIYFGLAVLAFAVILFLYKR